MEVQSKALGVPLLKVRIKKAYEDILATLTRLNKEEGIEGIVTGDIVVLAARRFIKRITMQCVSS